MFQHLPEIIRAIRKRRRENQAAFGAIIGADQSTVSQYETGRIEPSRAVLMNLQRLAETDEEKQAVAVWMGDEDPMYLREAPPENIVAQIRVASGLGVAAFAEAIRAGQIDVAEWETGRQIPPPAVVRRLQSVATKANRADLALILTSDDWKVRAVFHPGETFISTKWEKLPADEGYTAETPHAMFVSDAEKVHVEKLLRVLRSGHRKPAQAVIENLDTFFDFCELADNAAASAATGRGSGTGKAEAPHRPLAGDLPGQREKRRPESPGRVRPRKRA